MRTITIFGVTVVLAVLLQGCGRKAPLTLPASQAKTTQDQTSQPQTTSPQTPDPQKPEASPSQPIK